MTARARGMPHRCPWFGEGISSAAAHRVGKDSARWEWLIAVRMDNRTLDGARRDHLVTRQVELDLGKRRRSVRERRCVPQSSDCLANFGGAGRSARRRRSEVGVVVEPLAYAAEVRTEPLGLRRSSVDDGEVEISEKRYVS